MQRSRRLEGKFSSLLIILPHSLTLQMFNSEIISTEHIDLVHDVAYDYYGLRFATCSSDQTIKVWDKNENDEWTVTSSWKAHSASVWRLDWSHPEYGQILASCSFDRTVAVWEEALIEKASPGITMNRRWVRRAILVDSRTNVTDCKFAPKNLGLILATTSSDGFIRIYEAPEITNLSQWALQHEIDCKAPLSCISWNSSLYRLHAPMIAVGSDDASTTNTGKVFIFEYSENSRRWAKTETIASVTDEVHDLAFAPSLGRSYHILAVASKELHIFSIKPILDTTSPQRLEVAVANLADNSDRIATRVWRVSWNVTGTLLASTGDDNFVRLWKMNYRESWRCVCIFSPQSKIANLQESLPASTYDKPNTNTTRYYKRGTITHPNQVPWH